jgi:threonine/homoserine/homoserine lactone efflux protein
LRFVPSGSRFTATDTELAFCSTAAACHGHDVIASSAVLGVLAVALAMVLTPGPNMMYLVSRSITQGRRAGVISLLGVAVGFLVYLTLTNLGLSAIFIAVPQLYVAVKLSGAVYLGWLAYQALRPGGTSVFAPSLPEKDSPRRLFTMGLVTNLFNPKIAILYLSLIPQFVRPADGQVMLQGFILGAVQITVALTVNLLIVLTAGSIAMFLADRPVWLRIQRYLVGSALGALAIRLAADHTRPVPG